MGMTLSVPFLLLVSESLSDCKPPKELLRCNKKALCEKIVFNNHENQVKTSSFALKTTLKKVAEKWLFLTKKVADFRPDHLETLVFILACYSIPFAVVLSLVIDLEYFFTKKTLSDVQTDRYEALEN